MMSVVTKLFTEGQKRPKVIAVFRCEGSMSIFEPFNFKINSYIEFI
jgi:hypothetical protein